MNTGCVAGGRAGATNVELGLSASTQQNRVIAFGLSGLLTVRAAQKWVEWKGGRLCCRDPVGGDSRLLCV